MKPILGDSHQFNANKFGFFQKSIITISFCEQMALFGIKVANFSQYFSSKIFPKA
jgi:hypothetical protein